MAYYANAKGGIPFFKREEERRWNEHLRKHKEFVDQMRSAISFKKNAEQYDSVRFHASNVKFERERLVQIEHENNHLLAKLANVNRRTNHSVNQQMQTKSANHQSYRDNYKRDSGSNDNFSFSEEEKSHKESGDEKSDDGLKANFHKQLLKTSMLIDENPYCPVELRAFMKNDREIVAENIRLSKRLNDIKQGKNKHFLSQDYEQVNHRTIDGNSHKDNEEYEKKELLRKAENVRLNKKLQAIKDGKGRIPFDDPEFDPGERWWVTSPRARDLAKMQQEADKIRNEIRLKRENVLREKLIEQQKLLKERENLKKQKETPPGYHVKLRKKKKKYIDEKNNKNKEEKQEST